MSSSVTGLVVEDRSGARLLTITVPGGVVRLLAVVPVAVAVLAVHRAAPGTPWWPSVLVVLLAMVAVAIPDSGAGLVALAALVGWWLVAVPDPSARSAYLVAGCGLVFHLALAHAAAGPRGCAPSAAVVGRLAARCGWLLAVTGAVALVTGVGEEWGEPPAIVVALTLALAGALPWLAAARRGA